MSQPTETPTNTDEEPKPPKRQITITVDEDDPCLKQEQPEEVQETGTTPPDIDPRFQQQNISQRCYVMYTDFYRCEAILNEGHEACGWFKHVFNQICPTEWIERWDGLRSEGRFAWHKGKSQGPFPGSKYGV